MQGNGFLQYTGGLMDPKNFKNDLQSINGLLTHLHQEVCALQSCYSEVLQVLRKFDDVCQLDELTGLMRRQSFFKKWESLLDYCEHLNESCGIVMIDIDHFKSINDTHGHPTGDEVLSRIGELLKQFESPNCYSGRYGGEEFAVAVKGTEEEVLFVAEKIRKEAEKLQGPVIDSNGKPSRSVKWNCTVSVGVASTEKLGYGASRLQSAADEALYNAKNSGRNQVKKAA